MKSLDELQERWRYLYQDYLPALAAARDQAQKHWPVHLDHCFARIVLDNEVGVDTPWTEKVKSPAIKNMNAEQLQSAIQLAEKIATGEVNLGDLDQRSLELRGKEKKKRKAADEDSTSPASKKTKSNGTVSSYFSTSSSSKNAESDGTGSSYLERYPRFPPTKSAAKDGPKATVPAAPESLDSSIKPSEHKVDISIQLKHIADSNITAFRKQTLSLLCQIPRGRYSTYGAMADWISKNSHKTCARAVGNAMRNNPFAPEVPCHRILAGDGTLGGFKGSWGENGTYAKQKRDLLREEGVRFDSKGKVKGPVFRDFT